MANASHQTYYVPPSSWYPIVLAVGALLLLGGIGVWLNDLKAGVEPPNRWVFWAGALVLAFVLFHWFAKVIEENQEGLNSPQVKRSYVWGMSWFIFSEVMFFAAFFGALFYARFFVVQWLGGSGEKALTGQYLWPDFEPVWPVVKNPDPNLYSGPVETMKAPGLGDWLGYLPFWNTVILLSSSVTVHFAHTAIKDRARGKLLGWLGLTVVLGIVFLILQAEEYIHAYSELGLTLDSGIYGSTFFLLTGFHGFHVTIGTFILLIQWLRAYRGHFTADDCFGFEAASWYWHFVDVVWVALFLFVYVL
ncbi:MAG TPA: cytochrome c oxidase subunit 3 [Pseudomonadales bacterium]